MTARPLPKGSRKTGRAGACVGWVQRTLTSLANAREARSGCAARDGREGAGDSSRQHCKAARQIVSPRRDCARLLSAPLRDETAQEQAFGDSSCSAFYNGCGSKHGRQVAVSASPLESAAPVVGDGFAASHAAAVAGRSGAEDRAFGASITIRRAISARATSGRAGR